MIYNMILNFILSLVAFSRAYLALSSNFQETNSSILNATEVTRTPKSYEYRVLILKTDEDYRAAHLLQQYFVLRDECPFELNKYDLSVDMDESNKSCPSTADYMLCFPSTPVNHTVYYNCPYTQGLLLKDPDVKVSRLCKSNGQWESTNYQNCLRNLKSTEDALICRIKKNRKKELNHFKIDDLECDYPPQKSDIYFFKIMTLCNFIGFCITILVVSLAIFIFLSIRSLKCIRNMIHCNMLFTFLFKASAHFCFYIFILSGHIQVSSDNHFLCVVFNLVLNYSLMCSFFWMMIEAVYLITVIVAAYSSNKIKLWWYLIIGWIVPMIPIAPYSILTFNSSNTTCSWIQSEYNPVHEILIDIPIYILLTINCILLIVILYVIISKLRTHNDAVKTKYAQYKKLIRATLVLFPLFGLTFAVCIWLPLNPRTLFAKIYYCFNIFLQTTQGVWVAFVYCFLNDEVKNAVKTKLRSWKISHVGSSLLSFGSTTTSRHLSIPTLYSTQLSTNNSITRHRQDSNLNDPSRLPMLQEDKI